MTVLDEQSTATEQELAKSWVAAFGEALETQDAAKVVGLFRPDGHWRDVVSFTWNLHTFSGHAQLETAFEDALPQMRPSEVVLCPSPAPREVQRAGVTSIEAFIEFRTRYGRGRGVVRLVRGDDGSLSAWTLLTTLEELTGFEELSGERRSRGTGYSRNFGGQNWLDQRMAAQEYEDTDPAVLVVGGGQAGLAIAARLRHLNVDTLIVDRMKRIGDNWRQRYHSLALHNEVWVNHLPYMPFPDSWPVFVPKDKLANWFEAYVDAMELNFWTETEFVSASYDHEGRTWRAVLRRPDGSERVMHPRHVVMATGVSGIPHAPEIPGLDEFAGEVLHSSAYRAGSNYAGRSAVVIGTGNSGHDVAQDLHSFGASVTIVQRSSTTVVNAEPTAQKIYALYSEGLPTADCDLILASIPYPVLVRTYQLVTRQMQEEDRDLVTNLNAVGFRTDYGDDGTGFQMKYLRRGGGYYLNVGCSELISERKIGLVQYADIEKVDRDGLLLRDGNSVPADLIVLATGYKSQQELVRSRFGDAVADHVGPIWGYDDEGELQNMWKRSAQEGLWFHAGSLAQSRIFSKYLALQIKACEEGLIEKAAPAVPRALASKPAESPRGAPAPTSRG